MAEIDDKKEEVQKQILGTDPESEDLEKVLAGEEKEEKKPEPADLDFERVSKKDLELLKQKAQVFDVIDSDPGAVSMLNDYYRGNVRAPQPDKSNVETGTVDSISKKEFQAMKEQMRQMAAFMALDNFRRNHPDIDEYREEIGRKMQAHPTMTLQEAYDTVKGLRPATRKPEKSRLEVSEDRSRTVEPVTEPSQAEIQKKVVEAKSFDQAFDAALKEAVRQEAAKSEE